MRKLNRLYYFPELYLLVLSQVVEPLSLSFLTHKVRTLIFALHGL